MSLAIMFVPGGVGTITVDLRVLDEAGGGGGKGPFLSQPFPFLFLPFLVEIRWGVDIIASSSVSACCGLPEAGVVVGPVTDVSSSAVSPTSDSATSPSLRVSSIFTDDLLELTESFRFASTLLNSAKNSLDGLRAVLLRLGSSRIRSKFGESSTSGISLIFIFVSFGVLFHAG